jgi:hypothetical protein
MGGERGSLFGAVVDGVAMSFAGIPGEGYLSKPSFRVESEVTSLTEVSVVNKLNTYLLDPEHPIGKTKARWFETALGFIRENMNDLARQIKFDSEKAVFQKNNGYSDLFQQIIPIKGANGKKINTTFNWEIRNEESFPRLVGAIPVKPK